MARQTPATTAWCVIAAGTIARIALGLTIGLGVDESYAVAVARPVSLSYYDHPPLAFWIAAAASRAFGTTHDVLIRLPFIVLYAATSWMLYVLARRLYDDRAALFTVVLAQVIPVFGVSDGGWILPDGPLLFGFATTAWCLAHVALDVEDLPMRRWWLGAGIGAGIAALSKYHAIFLVAGTLVFLLTSARHRRWLARPEPYVAGAIAAAMALPVFVWNARHHWTSFRFQVDRAGVHVGWHSLTALLQNVAGQAGYLLPWVWIPLVWLLVRAGRRGLRDTRSWLLVCLGAPIVVVFTLVALGGRPGLPHWPAPGFFLLLPLLGDALARLRRARTYLAASAAIVVLLVSFAASQIRSGWFSRRFPALFQHGDPSLEALDWREARTLGDPVIIAANWIDAAKLGAALTPRATVLCWSDDPRQFRYVADEQKLIGSDALVVLRRSPRVDLDAERRRIGAAFRSIDSTAWQTIRIRRGGEPAVELLVFRAHALLDAVSASGRRRPVDLARQIQIDRSERQM